MAGFWYGSGNLHLAPDRSSHQHLITGIAPLYLANDFRRVADLGTWRRLCSASTPALVVPPSWLSTVGDRAFPVAAARVWNSLPEFVTVSTSLPMFKRHLKSVLFAKSY